MKKVFLLFFLLLCLSSIVFAVKPTPQTSVNANELQVIVPKVEYALEKHDFDFHVHVYNSTGFLMNSSFVNCSLHVYNNTGHHVLADFMSFDLVTQDFFYELNNTITANKGYVPYVVSCNSSLEAGYYSGTLDVNNKTEINGVPDLIGYAVLFVGILFFLLYLANSLKGEGWFAKGIRLLLIVLSVWSAVVGASLGVSFAVENYLGSAGLAGTQGLYDILIYFAWIFTFLLVIYYIYELLLFFRLKEKRRKDDILLGEQE